MKVLSIDHGTKKIGFAISDDEANFSRPLETIYIGKGQTDVEVALQVISQHQPSTILVGYPSGIDDKPTSQSKLVDNFVKKLNDATVAQLIKWNETYSSQDSKGSRDIDSKAAQLILQEYLNFKKTGI